MKLEDTLLNEISWLQKDKYYTTPLVGGTENVKFAATESGLVVTRDWQAGQNGELGFNVNRSSVCEDENNLEMGWS